MTALAAVEPTHESPYDLSGYPPGTVVIPCHDQARWHQFTYDMRMMDIPPGTYFSQQRSVSVVQNLNWAIETMAADSEWVWLIGDDHSFERNILLKLLEHDVDIVAPLCTKRGPPFSLVAMDEELGEDEHGRPCYRVMDFDQLPEEGLIEVPACGTAGMLIKRRVFDAIEPPYFCNSDGITVNEDMEFCRRVREAGFRVLLDTETMIGHIGMVVARPQRRDGVWGLLLDFGENSQIFLPNGGKASGN